MLSEESGQVGAVQEAVCKIGTRGLMDMNVNFTSFMLNYILRSSRGRMAFVLAILEYLGIGLQERKKNLRQLRMLLRSNHPFPDFLKRLNDNLSPRCRKRLVSNLIVRGLFQNRKKRKEFQEREGFFPPRCVSFAPTSRCNLSCDHCSGSGLAVEDIDPELVMRVMREARDEMGVYFFIMTGGEPFVYKELLSVIKNFPDCFFQVFTNGTLIDEDNVRRLAELGNTLIMLSLEGFEEATDRRRSGGTFKSVDNAMVRLKAAGVPFGFSVMTTSENCESITSEELIDWAIEKGCLVGYFFHYMPIGNDPDFSLLPTPYQRNLSRKNVYRWRNEKPIFLVDLINDGPLTGGCTSSGRHYLHVLSTGDVTPCVYCNFSTHNIKEVTLTEALKSPYLSTLRRAIPFEGNALRPCFLLDRPTFYFRMLELLHPHSCVPGEEERLKELKPRLKSYANQMKEIYNEAWEKGEWESIIKSVQWCIDN